MMISELKSIVPGNMAWKCNLLLPVSKDDEICEDMDIIISYVEYLESNGLISFTDNMRNRMIFYVTDIEGKELVYITVTLEEDTIYATTPLHFLSFPNQGKKIMLFRK